MTAYLTPAFSSSLKCFGSIVKDLSSENTTLLDAAAIETRIQDAGFKLMRQLMQDHLDLRAIKELETIAPMRAEDGIIRSQTTKTTRALGTIFGDVTVPRTTLVKRGVKGGLRPMDAFLNLPNGKYSFGVIGRIALHVATTSYTTAIENLKRDTATTVQRRQAQGMIRAVVIDFEDFYLNQEHLLIDDDTLLVLSFDGSGVIMRPEGLREETRKRARASRRRSTAETSASVGQLSVQKNRKRMAEVATIYDLKPDPRIPQDLIDRLSGPPPHPQRPKAQNKRVWASLSRDTPDVIDEAFVEAGMRDPEHARRWVVLLDGNEHQLNAVLRAAANAGVTVTVIVDFIHVIGYLWKAGKALVGPEKNDIESWVHERTDRLLQGKIRGLAGGMRHSATVRGLEGKAREAVDTCANYLLKYLDYGTYLRDGLPIATGVIEGACRFLVKDRMDITGARWGLSGGEAVLQVRSLRASGDLEAYLSFHAQRELERNHLKRFDGGELITLRPAPEPPSEELAPATITSTQLQHPEGLEGLDEDLKGGSPYSSSGKDLKVAA